MPLKKKLILAVCIVVFAVSSVLFVGLYWREYCISDRINMFFSYQLERAALTIAEQTAEPERPAWVTFFVDRVNERNPAGVGTNGSAAVKPPVLDEYADLYAQNKDLIGWIEIEGTLIDYPVMQTKGDPEFYLHRAFSGKYQYSGTPFMDPNSNVLLPSANFLIYAHNMINDTLFGQLPEYRDKSFYESHPTVRFDTIYAPGEYEVIAVFLSRIYAPGDDVFKYYQWGLIDNAEDFNYYWQNVQSLSLYDTGKSAVWGDQLLTLSTCYYHTEEGRFVVVARKIGP